MTKRFRNTLTVNFLLLASLLAFAPKANAGGAPTGAQITVRIYDMAGIESGTLEGAKKVTARVFEKIGVDINWLSCTWTGAAENPACGRPVRSNEIALRILRRSKTVRRSTGHITGGLSVWATEQGGSGFISLFYDRVEEVARIGKLSRSLVLGHMTAHEIGHLLLPEVGHSRRGIMRAKWGPRDWQRASKKLVFFPGRQAELLRAGVLARMRQQETAQLAALASLELAASQARQPEGRPARTTKEYSNVQDGSK